MPTQRPPSRTGRPWRVLTARLKMERDPVCHLCGGAIDLDLPGTHPMGWTADHLVPVALGGEVMDPANLAPAHLLCNRKRGAKPLHPRLPEGYLNDGTGRYRTASGLVTSRKW